jgi:kinesin family protein C1
MEGELSSNVDKGMIPRAVEEIFQQIDDYKENGWSFKIQCSFQEIYLEQIRDLLDVNKFQGTHNKTSAYQPTVLTVDTADDIYFLINKARENRMVAETKCNEHSSRSHSLFQLELNGNHPDIKGGVDICGALNLIDLAGSERLGVS